MLSEENGTSSRSLHSFIITENIQNDTIWMITVSYNKLLTDNKNITTFFNCFIIVEMFVQLKVTEV